MKEVEIFMIRKSFKPNSSEAIRKEAEDLINEKTLSIVSINQC